MRRLFATGGEFVSHEVKLYLSRGLFITELEYMPRKLTLFVVEDKYFCYKRQCMGASKANESKSHKLTNLISIKWRRVA